MTPSMRRRKIRLPATSRSSTPASVYDYDPNAQNLELLKRTEIRGGYDPANYASERMDPRQMAGDGTRIPISLV